MSERGMRIPVEAVDDASRVFQQVGRNAQKMGQDVERAGQQADRGFRGVSRSAQDFARNLDEIGTAIGAVAGGMALLGRNNLDAERSVDGLRRAYGDAADEILRFSEHIQDTTNFSNDAARAAALTGASLAQNYGLAAEQINQLVAVSADLAQIHGVTLESAMSRVAGAIRGEGEAAELLGLNMSDAAVAAAAAAQGLEGWRTTMTEAEKAAFRYTLVLDQAAFATGAAGDAAEGAAGRGYDFVHFLDDAAESAGGALGPMGEFLAVAGDLALAAPLAGNALGRLAQSATAARVATSGLALATNPLALAIGGAAVAAGLAYDAYRDMREAQDQASISTDEFADSQEALISALLQLSQAGAGPAAVAALRQYGETLFAIGRASNEVSQDEITAAQEAMRGFGDATGETVAVVDELGAVVVGASDATIGLYESLQGAKVTQDEYAQGFADLQTILSDTTRVNYPQLVAAVEELDRAYRAGEISADTFLRQLSEIAADVETYGLSLDDLAPRIRTLTAEQQAWMFELGYSADQIGAMGAAVAETIPTLDQMVAALTQHAEAAERSAAAQAELTDLVDVLQGDVREGNAAAREREAAALARLIDQRAGVVALAEAERDLARAANEVAAAHQAGTEAAVAAAHEELAAAVGDSTAALTDYQSALALASDGVWSLTDAMSLNVAMQGELNNVNSQYTTQIRALEEARDVLLERQAAGIALSQQEVDFLNEVDGTIGRLTGTVDDNTVAIGLQAQAWAENEQATGGVRAEWDQLPATMAELDETLGDVADAIRDLAEATLGVDFSKLRVPEDVIGSFHELRDAMAEAAGGPDALNAALTAGYNTGTAGESLTPPPDAGPAPGAPQIPGPMVVQVVADTSLAEAGIAAFVGWALGELAGGDFVATLDADPAPAEAGVAEASAAADAFTGADHTAIIQADPAPANGSIAEVAANLGAVTKAEWVATLGVNNTPALGGIEQAIGALRNFDASSGTVDLYANDYAAGVIASRLGYQGDAYIYVHAIPIGTGGAGGNLLPYAGGGVVPAANGRIVEAAEYGPETVYPPGGPPWLAAAHGAYVMPAGSYVRTAEATRAAPAGGGGITVNINAPVFGVDDLHREVYRAMSAAASVGVPNRLIELGVRR